MNNIELLSYHKHQFISVDRTLEIYFCGCSNNCKGCHNYELKEKNSKNCKFISPKEICETLYDYVSIAKQVHILGGEPLEQPTQALRMFTMILKSMGFKNIILFTGIDIKPDKNNKINKYNYERVFEFVDYVKTGPYKPEYENKEKNKDELTGIVLATTNQKIYMVV